ncbi:hypothetical protein KC19_11G119500 [Ceratodon purpureus]|uniref:Uncharacterized protein n=1 Tax=Ceratodon purpureus TaxID=3225 RepID=A0A8T0GG70_CERPU|nr:hypothetical protein KC19_11G119500 [Ceratodon purpureus]
MGEPTAPSAETKIYGDGFVSTTEDATEDYIDVWAQQGYTLSGKTEDGFSVFRFNGECHGKNEDLGALDPVEDADIESGLVQTTGRAPVIVKGERAKPLEWTYEYIKTDDRLQFKNERTFSVPGTDQDVEAEVLLHFAADGNAKNHTGFVMKVEQASVTVHNSKNDKNHRGHFLTRLEVKASPVPTVQNIVDGVKPEISDVPAETFDKQKSSTTSGALGFNSTGLTGGLGRSSGSSVTSSKRYHGWTLEKNGREKSLTWIWELEHWADGQPFHLDAPGRVNIKIKDRIMLAPTLPGLPDVFQFNTESGLAAILKPSSEADWLVPNDKLEGVNEFGWDVQVKFCTASVKVKSSFGKPVFEEGKFKALNQRIELKLN